MVTCVDALKMCNFFPLSSFHSLILNRAQQKDENIIF